jgi:hypothetical protein
MNQRLVLSSSVRNMTLILCFGGLQPSAMHATDVDGRPTGQQGNFAVHEREDKHAVGLTVCDSQQERCLYSAQTK